MACKLLCDEEEGGRPDQSQDHIVKKECGEIGENRFLARCLGKGDLGVLFLQSEKNEQ